MPRKSVVRLTDRPDMTLDVYLEDLNYHSKSLISFFFFFFSFLKSSSITCTFPLHVWDLGLPV